MIDTSTDYREEDKKKILHPEMWPRWPFLPMKKRVKDDAPTIGLMRAMKGEIGTTVYLIGLYEFSKGMEWKELPKEVYKNVDALLDDGWEID